MTDLKSLLPEELETFFGAMGESAYRARQVFQWIHEKDVSDFAQMTNLPLPLREKLSRTSLVTTATVEKKLVSARDGTVKFLFGFVQLQLGVGQLDRGLGQLPGQGQLPGFQLALLLL